MKQSEFSLKSIKLIDSLLNLAIDHEQRSHLLRWFENNFEQIHCEYSFSEKAIVTSKSEFKKIQEYQIRYCLYNIYENENFKKCYINEKLINLDEYDREIPWPYYEEKYRVSMLVWKPK